MNESSEKSSNNPNNSKNNTRNNNSNNNNKNSRNKSYRGRGGWRKTPINSGDRRILDRHSVFQSENELPSNDQIYEFQQSGVLVNEVDPQRNTRIIANQSRYEKRSRNKNYNRFKKFN